SCCRPHTARRSVTCAGLCREFMHRLVPSLRRTRPVALLLLVAAIAAAPDCGGATRDVDVAPSEDAGTDAREAGGAAGHGGAGGNPFSTGDIMPLTASSSTGTPEPCSLCDGYLMCCNGTCVDSTS